MTLDHGFVQALDLLLGGIDRVPVIPIMINCGGELRPPLWRARELGRAAGAWARSLGRRVLFLGSGGLSHDPPLPEFVGSPADVQQRLIAGVSYTPELLRERTQRVQRAGQDFARENTLRLLPLNAAWDREVLALFERGALDEVASWTDTAVRTAGGRGGAEIRNWLAALAALESAAGAYSCVTDFYQPVPELICGYAMMHAWPRTARPALVG
jgi:2,3-dihydroxyphenylpropionate 1,2-dioxygenase